MGDTQPTVRTWEPQRLTEPAPPPFKIRVMAFWLNTGGAELALWCSCAHELSYAARDGDVPLDELNTDAAEHLRSHGQPRIETPRPSVMATGTAHPVTMQP